MWMPPDALARAEERRISSAVAEIALTSIEVAGGTVCWGGAGSWMNEARGVGMAGPVEAEEVERALAFLRDRGAKARFDVCPYADPSLLRLLGDRGLRPLSFETVLYRALGEDIPDASLADGMELVRVGPEEAEAFVQNVGRWFDEEGKPPDEVTAWATRQLLGHPKIEAWLIRAGRQWVGGGALETWPGSGKGEGLSALIMTSVAPEFRRRGVQLALMAHRLRRARELGASTAVIGSDPRIATGRNALRMGFRVAYTKVAIGDP